MSKTFVMPTEWPARKGCGRPLAHGLGDVLATFLKLPVISQIVKAATGIDPDKPCGGCKKRRKWLNKKIPLNLGYVQKEKADGSSRQ
jgi:hypothetical protein